MGVINPGIFATCITMDGTTANPPDNGALSNDRIAFPNARFSSDINSAAANLISCSRSGARNAQIVGHGGDGFINVGGGQYSTNEQAIWSENSWLWQPAFAPLKGNINDLRLYGCHVGANAPGASLVYQLAQFLNCAVSAPTGLMISSSDGHVTFEPGTVWQHAGPSFPARTITLPAPIAPPSPEEVEPESVQLSVRLRRGPDTVEIPEEDIERVLLFGPAQVRDAGHHHGLPSERKVWETAVDGVLASREITELLRHGNLDRPVNLGGALNAVRTGSIQLEIKDGRLFGLAIYNDRILQDLANPTLYYRVASSFSDVLNFLRGNQSGGDHAMAYTWVAPTGSGTRAAVGNSNEMRSVEITLLCGYEPRTQLRPFIRTEVVAPLSMTDVGTFSDSSTGDVLSVEILTARWV
jgi:Domain of unknown function (DUF4347)